MSQTTRDLGKLFASDEYQAMLEDARRQQQKDHDELWGRYFKPLAEKLHIVEPDS